MGDFENNTPDPQPYTEPETETSGYGYEPERKKSSGFFKGLLILLLGVFIGGLGCLFFMGVNGYFTKPDDGGTAVQTGTDSGRRRRGSSQTTASPSQGTEAQPTDPQPVDNEELLNAQTLKELADIERFIDMYYLYDQDRQAMRDGILSGLVRSLDDDYAYYYNAAEFAQLLEDDSGEYCGIGVQVTQEAATMQITVTKVFKGSPALAAGVLPGDILREVDGMSVQDMDLNTVVTYIRGEPDTTVELTFYRPSLREDVTLICGRAKIDTPSVEWEMLDDDIGYILIDQFIENTYDQYVKALDDLSAQGMEGLIIDVRNNPGGLLDIVVDMCDEMVGEGLIISVRDRDGAEENYYSDRHQRVSMPTIVLVNGGSASAAEIFTANMQDHGIATIMGTKTFGKGIVQTILPLSGYKTALKITTAEYYTPNGICIHGEGIEPDIVVELDEEAQSQAILEHEDDNQLQAAIEELRGMMR